MMKATCKDCPDRAVGCHSSCERYLEAKAEHEKREADKRAYAMVNLDAREVQRRAMEKLKRRAHSRF